MVAVVAAVAALVVGVAVGMTISRRPAKTVQAPAQPDSPLTPAVIDVLTVLQSIAIVVDASDRVVWSSPTAGALGLVRSSEVANAALLELAREVRREGQIRETELQVARGRTGGSHLVLGVRVAPLSARHVLLLVQDRTAAQRVEEIRRDFVVNVSHELKTPVAGLSLLAEAVDEARDDSAAVHRFAGRMQAESTRLARLVQEIVQLSRLQVADTLAEPALVDVVTCAREAVDHVRIVAEDKRIRIGTSYSGDAMVYGDENLITTAIRNLVENAVNYSENDTQVSVTVHADPDVVSVVVKDQGSGIPAAELDRIFERFYRVDPARSRHTGGTGLGLAIVKHVCANHGGEVAVWSEEGQGSTFTMRLPAATAAVPDTPAIPVTTRKVTS
ncbi:sensor histidine kinase [Flexivirga caeni]|uniref:Sensor-like histidine kinase SenX3 n=1 Tax=Flexivirga caeni TaxID=2294115 RepID=A0A3M9MF35_9MICO|nr:ATP-binding protein [Flexivirga caeni]RNI23805.1 two-component sensor histidine kinase [Flexivirga caeni]